VPSCCPIYRTRLGRARNIALLVPLVLFGYGFLMTALASVLSDAWGAPWGLVAVGGLQLLAGAGGLVWLSRSREALRRPLERASRELVRSVEQAGEALVSRPAQVVSLP